MEITRGPHYNQHPLTTYLSRLIDAMHTSQTVMVISTSVAVGLGTGVAALILRRFIDITTTLAFRNCRSLLVFLGAYDTLLIPALGGLLVGPVIYCLARQAKGHGVLEVIEAVALRGGRMRPVTTVIKSLAASICIGTGGSVGREGPIIQAGAGLGSTLGQWLKLSEAHIRSLVACGAAGGIAATFNVPIAGVVFALEIILETFSPTSFSTVVIASVTASEVARALAGNSPAFVVPPYALVSLWEFPFYAMLGMAAAVVGAVFTRALRVVDEVFEGLTFPVYLKPVAGGLLLGAIGVGFPQIFGVGHETITQALHNELSLRLMVMLMVVKMLATALTLGSGGMGGILVPSLFLGAMLGGSFGTAIHTLLPAVTAVPGTYALVGMAAVFAAAARAPITAIIMLFEMTGDYRIILPLMLTTVIGAVCAERIATESIYTSQLSRRGIRLTSRHTVDVLQTVRVGEVMGTPVNTVTTTMGLTALARMFERMPHHSFPVLDAHGTLYGMLGVQDLAQALAQEALDRPTAGDIATTTWVAVYPDDPVSIAIRCMAEYNLQCLPVVDRSDTRRLLGMVHWEDVSRAYNIILQRRRES
jgi:CIC family chloride channel protein